MAITYVCAGCGRFRTKSNTPFWDWYLDRQKKCRCGSCSIRPQTPREIVFSRNKRKRPNKKWRRERRIAIILKRRYKIDQQLMRDHAMPRDPLPPSLFSGARSWSSSPH